ncbi:hypothetical protein ACIP2X_14715 [Streptomyces sp. NPDC089424]|uniref:hypothetical protein n=1 Tax=Streptomyces sp. NPDC089424 TaxID=3365917 RepID=UPI00381D6486
MHRTTTTATLLVTVALSAVSGCVTVQRGPAAVPSAPAPGPDGRTEPQIVQAPAREALELIGPSRRPGTAAPESHRPTAQAPAAPARRAPSPRAQSRPHSDPPSPQPRRPRQPPATVPDVAPTLGTDTDVCALGRKYGGWRPDSPEAVICEQTYGR